MISLPIFYLDNYASVLGVLFFWKRFRYFFFQKYFNFFDRKCMPMFMCCKVCFIVYICTYINIFAFSCSCLLWYSEQYNLFLCLKQITVYLRSSGRKRKNSLLSWKKVSILTGRKSVMCVCLCKTHTLY